MVTDNLLTALLESINVLLLKLLHFSSINVSSSKLMYFSSNIIYACNSMTASEYNGHAKVVCIKEILLCYLIGMH